MRGGRGGHEEVSTFFCERIDDDVPLCLYRYAQSGRNASQCGQSMPIFMDMVPPEQKQPAVNQLIETVKAANGSMLVGMFGIKWFLMALAENNAADLAYNSIATTTYPSYGYVSRVACAALVLRMACCFAHAYCLNCSVPSMYIIATYTVDGV